MHLPGRHSCRQRRPRRSFGFPALQRRRWRQSAPAGPACCSGVPAAVSASIPAFRSRRRALAIRIEETDDDPRRERGQQPGQPGKVLDMKIETGLLREEHRVVAPDDAPPADAPGQFPEKERPHHRTARNGRLQQARIAGHGHQEIIRDSRGDRSRANGAGTAAGRGSRKQWRRHPAFSG